MTKRTGGVAFPSRSLIRRTGLRERERDEEDRSLLTEADGVGSSLGRVSSGDDILMRLSAFVTGRRSAFRLRVRPLGGSLPCSGCADVIDPDVKILC